MYNTKNFSGQQLHIHHPKRPRDRQLGQSKVNKDKVNQAEFIAREVVWKWPVERSFLGAFSALDSFHLLFFAPINCPWVSKDAQTCTGSL